MNGGPAAAYGCDAAHRRCYLVQGKLRGRRQTGACGVDPPGEFFLEAAALRLWTPFDSINRDGTRPHPESRWSNLADLWDRQCVHR
jgi:hypothetical protein